MVARNSFKQQVRAGWWRWRGTESIWPGEDTAVEAHCRSGSGTERCCRSQSHTITDKCNLIKTCTVKFKYKLYLAWAAQRNKPWNYSKKLISTSTQQIMKPSLCPQMRKTTSLTLSLSKLGLQRAMKQNYRLRLHVFVGYVESKPGETHTLVYTQ